MKRREFIAVLGGAAWPMVANAQQGRIYRLGCLLPAERHDPAIVAFFDELRIQGFVEGRNLDVIPGADSGAGTAAVRPNGRDAWRWSARGS